MPAKTSGKGKRNPTRDKPKDIKPLDAFIVDKTQTYVRPSSTVKRRFIAWDGEQTQDGAGYCLFGNSEGLELCQRNLSSEQMLELIIETGRQFPNAFHVGFVWDYDVNWIIKDLSWSRLAILRDTGKVHWRGYTIEHMRSKSFIVSYGKDKERVRVRIDNCYHWFKTSFLKALIKYDIGTASELAKIAEGKKDRPDFTFDQIDAHIRPYWQLELKLMVLLMDKMRRDVNKAGFYIGQWHGHGALASNALSRNGVAKHKETTPDYLSLYVRKAFQGGWFERFKAGVYYGPVYIADINSAYAFAMSRLPSMANGEWEHVTDDAKLREWAESGIRMGLFHIKYNHGMSQWWRANKGAPLPLFCRDENKNITHSYNMDGWYWKPDARSVMRDPNAEFVEGYIFHDDGTIPFQWVEDMYYKRLALQAENDPAEKGLKWALASLYGKTAQRTGWDKRTRESPFWHQLEWGGTITSTCRNMIYAAARRCINDSPGCLLSIDTDGIISTSPFKWLPWGEGNQLGRWKVEEYTGIVYIQNGVYWLRKANGEWVHKVRGIPSDQIPTVDDAIESLRDGGELKVMGQSFIGYTQALQGQRDKWLTWQDRPIVKRVNSPGSKRYHLPKGCPQCISGQGGMDECLHELWADMANSGTESGAHLLPWLEPVESRDTQEWREKLWAEFNIVMP